MSPALGSKRGSILAVSVSASPSVMSPDGVEATAGRAVTSSVTVAGAESPPELVARYVNVSVPAKSSAAV